MDIKELHKALLSAFPSKDVLRQMVRFQLGENLDAMPSARRSHRWK